jgi:glycosyltransferase involved in cell wall biosynthesis
MIFVAMENWDEIWRRNQPVAAGFARRHPQCKILFVGLSIDISNSIRRGKVASLWRALLGTQLSSPPDLPNIFLFNPVKWLPNTLTIGRAINRWSERRQIRRACRRIGIDRPLLWLNPYYAIHLLGRMGECAVVYDVGDDWTSFKQQPWFLRLIKQEDDELTGRADVVIVVSERLFEMKRTLAKRLHHIPNGVYVEQYAKIADRTVAAHEITRDWPKPVLGYTGTIHPDRVDLALVEQLAQRMPQATVALVGPVQLDEPNRRRLEAIPNIKLPGPVPFEQVPSVMAGFDVCIVPHRVTDFTESLSPLKLYEYLASGLPIVSTPVSGFRDCGELVHLASDAETFATAVTAALVEPVGFRDRRRAVVATQTWDNRMDAIEAALQPVLGRAEVVHEEPKPSTERTTPLRQEVSHAG